MRHIDLFALNTKNKKKNPHNSKLFSKYFCTAALVFSAPSQTVIKRSQRNWFFFFSLSFIYSPQTDHFFCGSKCKLLPNNLHLHSIHVFFLSSPQRFRIMQITHSAGLLIGSRDASSRFKWKCKVCLEWKVIWSDEPGLHENIVHLVPL